MSLSRRDFLKGSLATGVAAMGASGLASCAPAGSGDAGGKGQTGSGADASAQPSFLTPPDPISDDDIAETIESEVVVVGSGPAGFFSAVSAYEHGADVRIVSSSEGPVAHGGDYWGFNTEAMERNGVPFVDVDAVIKRRVRDNEYKVDQEKWRLIARRNPEVMNWLVDKMEAAGYRTIILDGYEVPSTGEVLVERGTHQWVSEDQALGTQGTAVLDVLTATAAADGIPIDYLHEAQMLVQDEATGRVIGVIAKDGEGTYKKYLASKGVVLATGDYTADQEMLQTYCADFAGLGYGGMYSGLGHKMALWAGAAWQRIVPGGGMAGSLCGANAAFNDCLGFCGLMLNERGRRYSNEACASGHAAVAQLRQPNGNAVAVWDASYASQAVGPWAESWARPTADPEQLPGAWAESVGVPTAIPGAPEQICVAGNTIEELAEQLGEAFGTDPAGFVEGIERYNELCDAGADEDFGKSSEFMVPVRTAPFYARYGGPSFLIATGGIRTDTSMRVLDEEDSPIPGLYAAGTIVGDMYTNYDFALGGIHLGGNCMTFGYVAGESVAQEQGM